MKKIAILSVAALLFACNNTNKPAPTGDIEIETAEIIEPIADKAHNAKNSLDYKGTYKGTLPTASGSGMEVTVTLGDSTYTREIKYLEKKDKPFVNNGKYTWSEDGSVITLVGEDKPNQYHIEENAIRHLDVDGNKITGDTETDYILKKQL